MKIGYNIHMYIETMRYKCSQFLQSFHLDFYEVFIILMINTWAKEYLVSWLPFPSVPYILLSFICCLSVLLIFHLPLILTNPFGNLIIQLHFTVPSILVTSFDLKRSNFTWVQPCLIWWSFDMRKVLVPRNLPCEFRGSQLMTNSWCPSGQGINI